MILLVVIGTALCSLAGVNGIPVEIESPCKSSEMSYNYIKAI